uniref:Uncharacterized protein n=1 Tax=Setaria italica TaxID=4555 RepID=K3ZBT0_SETIT
MWRRGIDGKPCGFFRIPLHHDLFEDGWNLVGCLLTPLLSKPLFFQQCYFVD